MWLLTLPHAIVGSQLAHALAYLLVTPDANEREHELAASGHAYLAYAPTALAVCAVVVALALAGELGHVLRKHGEPAYPASALRFAVLAPAIFVCQEYFERLLHDGVFPVETALEPSFAVGLVLQLPFALAAYLVARLLLRAVRSLGGALSRPAGSHALAGDLSRPAFALFAPRARALALGYGSRGPPATSR